MKFQDIHKHYFNAESGAFSPVTETEYNDSQVTLDKDEKDIVFKCIKKEEILKGNKSSNPALASKHFLLYPEKKEVTLNLLYPKPEKTELRLYLSSEHGFKPNSGDIWFVYASESNNLAIGFMSKEEWDEIGLGEELNFRPRARLLLQLGDQLIRNEAIALTELVKNSFDADASYCKVKLQNVDSKENGQIVIEDDGWGMDINVLKNAWLEPGSDTKEKIINEKEYSPKGRLPIGEKGIGRFGVHKLGRKIELISKKKNCNEVVVKIDWNQFKDHKYLDKAPVKVFEREIPKIFTGNKTGTIITIDKLPIAWTRGKLRDAYRAINAISIPNTYDPDKPSNEIKDENGFEVISETNLSDWVNDIPDWKDILQYSLFFFDIGILNDQITDFYYQFRPWDNMNLSGRKIHIDEKPINGLLDIDVGKSKKFEPLMVPDSIKIGKVRFKGCIFVRDKGILKLGLNKPTFLTDYLNENGGIRVYRNGLRVYDYGERGNDWLSLDYRRFNDPGVKISNNLLLASITLDREDSSSLIEKTNREGFIENQAYEIFQQQILYALRLIEICREPDKKKLDQSFKPKKETESVLKSIFNLRGFIDQEITEPKRNKQFKEYVDKVEVNYRFMYDKLVKSASAGMGWSIYLHEIEKIIKEIEKVIKSGKEEERAVKLVNHLSKLIESYSQILRKSTRTSESLKTIIDQSLFNVDFRFRAHKITLVREYKNFEGDDKIKLSRNLIVSTLMNLYDNSIYWLDRSGMEDKKIRVAISNEKDGYISVVVSDNGTGFLMSPEEMKEPLLSARGGMGMGLHLANEIMEGHNDSKLSFNEYGEFEIPIEFQQGATVALCFKI